MLCLPSFHHIIATRCYVAGVSLPSTNIDPAKPVTSWLVKLDGCVVPRGTTRVASRIFKPAAQRKCLPTAHINVANDFYEDPENLAAAAGVVAPDALCNMGNRETCTHLLIDCPFTQDVWNLFTAALSAFGFSYPTSLQACLFDIPRLQRRWQCLCFDQVWPIVRACIWFTLWKARNDVIFCQDRTPAASEAVALKATSEAVALKATFAVKKRLQHLVLQDPEDHSLLRFLLALEQNAWARAHLVPRRVV
ncbi:hypothetical protein ACHHYP_12239 [Achlya hypogyna]|uniref:Reverse transcriptase zinc-binding domain-containing protein n=1 Tax=Achlya hypogyna TaxID=1202772 RepID=A0A1V9YHF2_ACHHY|nr:hypothetical protein ACHHYP_12239 [Achlya hypogyna]